MAYSSYLNLDLKSTSESDAAKTKIVVLSKPDQLDDLQLSEALQEKIKRVFKQGKDEVITHFGDELKFVVISQTDAIEPNQMMGVSLYEALAKEEALSTEIKALQLDPRSQNAFLEGLILGSYSFDPYINQDKKDQLEVFVPTVICPEEDLKKTVNLCEGVALTRTVVNEPTNELDSLKFSERITEAGEKFGFNTTVLHKNEIEELGMGGLLAVNQGSDVPPTFNILHYKPKNPVNKKPLVFVGKGVTFDTGGYSLKISGSMSTMKADMGGGGSVLGIMAAVAKNELPYEVVGLIPSTDNKINGKALLVDDIIKISDGTTVEIQNTDAEGRLIMSDALAYAKKYNPELVIDMATLTGAAAAVTGPYGVAMAGNTQSEMDKMTKSGHNTYERVVQFPLWQEFRDLLDSEVADIKNVGGKVGGASIAGKFLEHFTDYNWMHLDIAGAAFISKKHGAKPSGATGTGVRLVYDFIKNASEQS